MKIVRYAVAMTLCFAAATGMADDEKKDDTAAGKEKAPASVHDFKVNSLEGKEVDLSKYKGKVLLVVNVASQCGATPQYRQLQALHEKYSDKGLVVMGFPCNQFGAQEPGSAKEIREFCSLQYRVKFPMFAKVDVNGSKQAPLYGFLKSAADDHSNIGWNFEKFVISRDGKVAGRFRTPVKPDAPEVVKLLEEELSK